MSSSEKPGYWTEACALLAKRDKRMAKVIAAHPERMLATRGDAMVTLMRSVVGQQISVKAAASIWAKFEALLEDDITAVRVLAQDENALRGCGFSGSKVRYVRGIAEGFLSGVVHPGVWDGMDDEAVIRELVKLPGIGRWTAEMFLMFHLMRPDVLAVDDLGLVKGFRMIYGATFKDTEEIPFKVWQLRMREKADDWRPYRSVASWYLWRVLDPMDVLY